MLKGTVPSGVSRENLLLASCQLRKLNQNILGGSADLSHNTAGAFLLDETLFSPAEEDPPRDRASLAGDAVTDQTNCTFQEIRFSCKEPGVRGLAWVFNGNHCSSLSGGMALLYLGLADGVLKRSVCSHHTNSILSGSLQTWFSSSGGQQSLLGGEESRLSVQLAFPLP